jgi:uncharacterized protein YndB with AHSA1/START domain
VAAGRSERLSLSVSRIFDASPEIVFDAWLDAESVAQWLFATPGGVMERVHIEPRVGGMFEVFERRGEQLATHFGTYVEIDRPRRLAFDFATERDGAATRVTITFEAHGRGCLVTLTHELDAAWAEYQDRVKAGWVGILEGLEGALAGEVVAGRQIVQVREFAASRARVWEAWTNPEHVDHWWGPDGFVTRTESMDVRPDGRWRYTMTGPDGTVYPNFVLYMDVSAPERLIYAHGADETAPPHFHVTVIFEALGANRTRVTMTSLFPSRAARDFVVERFDAIEGGKQTLARLAGYLEGMR